MPVLSKVLVANRGEIAVRIIRACRDAGLATVAVYADPDRTALHTTLADEAYALGGVRAQETYLDIGKILDAARRSGADTIHPGYGFLAEDADFARAVTQAGLTWVGPSADTIDTLGDKTRARQLAESVGAPLVPGSPDPVDSVEAVREFAETHGFPIAIKAAYGGGGRGLKIARTMAEIPDQYESAVREATAAFGRGECYVERYLDRPRHVETQCLADSHGTVVVVSTRDCTLQRRHQKLIEEAPAPFLLAEQIAELHQASVAILRAAGYVGAGTCEFLVADGAISFLEVNTRIQVEHPVSEEITGLDLIREQLRIAAGEPLGYDHVPSRGHSIEFRINGEDPAADFLPAPGRITELVWPSGPGVRVDAGVAVGDNISGAFDSLLAKIIVTGATRTQAIERARRALAETVIGDIPTVLPFHQHVLNSPDFVTPTGQSFEVHTRWIETDFMANLTAAPSDAPSRVAHVDAELPEPERVVVEVGGKRIEVVLPGGLGLSGRRAARRPVRRSTARPPSTGTTLTAPMQGTLVTISVANGDTVAQGDVVVVLEAMKMEQPLRAHRSGVISGLDAQLGATIAAGTKICEIT